MGSWKRLFGSSPRIARIEDPELGPLRFDADEECWIGTIIAADGAMRLLLAGDDQPGEPTLERAREIRRDFPAIERTLATFIEQEAEGRSRHADEIRRLHISDVCLLWPDRPADGMIYFTGGQDGRLWRCDFLGGRPSSLGYDS